jgi:hypothetical protein
MNGLATIRGGHRVPQIKSHVLLKREDAERLKSLVAGAIEKLADKDGPTVDELRDDLGQVQEALVEAIKA